MCILDDTSDKDWFKARCKGVEGYVPANYLALPDPNAEPLMHEACRRNHVELLEECLANKVAINAQDKTGNTPLHWAAKTGSVDCLNRLIRFKNLDVNARNKLGETALHQAASKGRADCIEMLFDQKIHTVQADLENSDGKTALQLCHDPEAKNILHRMMNLSKYNTGYKEEDYEKSDNEEE